MAKHRVRTIRTVRDTHLLVKIKNPDYSQAQSRDELFAARRGDSRARYRKQPLWLSIEGVRCAIPQGQSRSKPDVQPEPDR